MSTLLYNVLHPYSKSVGQVLTYMLYEQELFSIKCIMYSDMCIITFHTFINVLLADVHSPAMNYTRHIHINSCVYKRRRVLASIHFK